jgi:hypothetical protein
MKENKNDLLAHMDKILERETIIAYKKSRGTVIMKNGFVFQVSSLFNFFRDTWYSYTKASLEPNEERRIELLKLSNNGIVSNGNITFDLSDVSAMLAEGENPNFMYESEDSELDENDLEDDSIEFN